MSELGNYGERHFQCLERMRVLELLRLAQKDRAPLTFVTCPAEHRAVARNPLHDDECDCGGPAGHVPGGVHCRRSHL